MIVVLPWRIMALVETSKPKLNHTSRLFIKAREKQFLVSVCKSSTHIHIRMHIHIHIHINIHIHIFIHIYSCTHTHI